MVQHVRLRHIAPLHTQARIHPEYSVSDLHTKTLATKVTFRRQIRVRKGRARDNVFLSKSTCCHFFEIDLPKSIRPERQVLETCISPTRTAAPLNADLTSRSRSEIHRHASPVALPVVTSRDGVRFP